MALQHGRGKEAFRALTKSVNQLKRDTLAAVKSGEAYTAADISRFIHEIITEYTQTLPDLGVDVDFWSDRAIYLEVNTYSTILEKTGIVEARVFETEESQKEIEDSTEERTSQKDGDLFGIDIMTKENKGRIRSLGKPRKRILDSLDDLEEYVQDVPYILAIQILKGTDNRVLGYRVWVEAAKEKKKRKSAL